MKTMLSILFALTLFGSLCQAQNPDSLWTSAALGNEAEWLTLTADGTLIASTNQLRDGATSGADIYTVLSGIDTQTGKVKWRYPASSSASARRISGLDFVPNTPFVQLRNVPLTVIDPYDGHVIIDIAAEGITQEESHGYLLESGHLWVNGMVGGNRCISVFDLTSGKKLWSNADFLKEKNKAASKLNKLSALTGSAMPNKEPIRLLGTPINHGADKMILATSNGVFDVQIATGQMAWEAELPDPNKGKMVKVETDINFMRLIPGRNKFYVVKAAYITAYSYTDGKPVWANVVKTSGPIDQIIYDEKGLILCPGSSNVKGMFATGYLQMVNEKTGEPLWGDGIKFNGGIKTYLYTDKGLAVVMVNSEEKNSINFIDVAQGKFTLSKNISLAGEVQYLELVSKGLLFKTDRTINILSLDSGEPILSLPVQTKKERAIITASEGDRYYFYSDADQNVYEINKATGASRKLNNGKIDFKGGEAPGFIEVRKDGVSLYSEQNATLLGFDGTARFAVFNPGVRTVHTALQNAGNALDAMNQLMTIANAGQQTAVTLASSQARNQYDQLSQALAAAGNATYVMNLKQFQSIRNRLHASARSNDNIFMMTRIADRSMLVGVSKDTGATVSKIPLARRDENPMYQVDAVSGLLFYAPKGKNLLGWSNTAYAISCFTTARR